ncbi:hypothetical protein ACFYOY_13510 [Streptomyces sp. NPDC007875]|uniref:hypothetical protein n=1 Tax=Streptomyces sp. NPDC007875 TaxID=3364783 RepID=UPI00367C536F
MITTVPTVYEIADLLHGAHHTLRRNWPQDPPRGIQDALDTIQRSARSLEGWTPDCQFTPTAGDMFAVHHGVALAPYGDDSSCIALGHIDQELMVQAAGEFMLDLTGEPLTRRPAHRARLIDRVRRTWAVYWRTDRQWFDFDDDQRTPGAVPVTILPGD